MIWRCDLVPQYEKYRTEIHQAIDRVLKTGRYILASEVASFEAEFAAYLGAKHVVSVANATDGLTLALRALGVGPGDEVITTPFTAIPTVSAIVDSGARPVFVDVDPDTFLMDLAQVPGAITPRTKAIMPVHIFGNVVDIPKLRNIVGPGIRIVEDSSQSHGSKLDGKQTGTMGDAGVFSFYPTKNLGAYGDGGAICTDDPELAAKLKLMRMYGMVDKDHIAIHGINSRLDEMQAAILRAKLVHLDSMNHARNRIVARYRRELRSDLFRHQTVTAGAYSNYHVFVARFLGDRAAFIRHMESHDIQTNIYYVLPLHLQQATADLGMKSGSLPKVEALCTDVVSLTLYPELEDHVLDLVIAASNSFKG